MITIAGTRIVHHGDEQVAHAVVQVALGQADGVPAFNEVHRAFVNEVASGHSHDGIGGSKAFLVGSLDIDSDVAAEATIDGIEANAHDGSVEVDFVSQNNLL